MKSTIQLKKNFFVAALFFVAIIFNNTAFAQVPLSSAGDLKTACETSPGNIVQISQSVKISQPTVSTYATQVNCGCTIIISNEATFEFELANVSFAGAFNVQSTGKSTFKLSKTQLATTSVAINLGGIGSDFSSSESAIAASAGNFIASLGPQAKFEVYGKYSRSVANSISATGATNISAGERCTGSVTDAAIVGNQGVQINISGTEGLLKVGGTLFSAANGSVGLLATGSKSLLEMKETSLHAKDNIKVEFTGDESMIKMEQCFFSSPTFNQFLTGGVTITAAAGTANRGKVEMTQCTVSQINGNLLVRATQNGEYGGVKIEKARIFGVVGSAVFSTGNFGSTEVKENSITSNTSITVSTGNNGTCLATPNSLTAPVINACTPPAARAAVSNFTKNEPLAIMDGTVNVFPNPSSNGTVNVNLNKDNAVNIAIVNTIGSSIKQWNNYTNKTLVITELKTGNYYLKVTDIKTGKTSVKPFLIM